MNTSNCRVCPVAVGDPQDTDMHEKGNNKRKLTELRRRQYARLEAPVEDLREYFGIDADRLASLTLEVNVCDFLMAQRALAGLLEKWRVTRESRYHRIRPAMIERHAVEVAPERYDFVIKDGRQFWEGPEEERLVVDLCVYDDRREPYSEIVFRLPQTRYGWLAGLLPRLHRWMDEHHFLRGQAIDAKGEFVRFERAVTWEDVFLPPEVRDSIDRNCVQLLRHSALYKANGVPLKRGILLHGPPGTGKTMIGKVLSQDCGVTFILVTPGMLEEPAHVRRVFEWGRRLAPSILFFEDFDLVAGDRHSGRSSGGLLGDFLTCLDGLSSTEGVIVVATTNNLRAIEPALKDRPNRFDCVLEVPPMARRERRAYLEKWRGERDGRFDVKRIAARTEGYTGAQLQELCRLAVQEAVVESVAGGRTEPGAIPVSEKCVERALGKINVKARKRIGFTARADEDEEE